MAPNAATHSELAHLRQQNDIRLQKHALDLLDMWDKRSCIFEDGVHPDVPSPAFTSLADAFHGSTPLEQRLCFQNCLLLREKMKNAKDYLRDISVEYIVRIRHTINAFDEAYQLTSEMTKTLAELMGHIAKLEDVRVSIAHREGFVPPSWAQQEAHGEALAIWAFCLPETALQLRAGRERKDILQAVLEPQEEIQVPTLTEMSSVMTMPLSPSTKRDPYNTKEVVRMIRARNAMDPTRATDIYTDELIDLNCPQALHIFKWMSTLPSDLTQFVESEDPPEMTADIYKDYLNWASNVVERLEKELDLHETKYRRLGLKYHETPLYLRDPTTTPADPRVRGLPPGDIRMCSAATAIIPINPAILVSLDAIFNSDRPRATQSFFTNWRTVQNGFANIRTLLNIDYHHFERHQLQALLSSVQHDMNIASKLLARISTQLEGVGQNLREVVARRRMAEGAKLTDAFGVEGSAFRRWVSLFPEVAGGEVEVEVVERVLRVCGAELSMDWKGDYGSGENENEEERTEGLGARWEADREYDD
ncbi:hypothetical protein P171DRAFT_491121 [Karstenula rhodostoma CBS 690.94]|uniref:Uncharacterized protein n=1 Tax=Karstenula rhodostoma CBS 690.94 TaxID=1392251 RepID=A0A9P4P6X6_9PLEO|nr:hypothetical protein P171DRAFT_491121 [Karstenula rhodostoma CBS 690.94]